jgi:hypothetical protein
VQFPLADTQLIHRSMARGGVEPQTHRSSPAPRVPTNGRDVAHERMECPRAGSIPPLIPDSLVPSMGLVVLTQTGQGNAEVAGQAQGVGVVIAQWGTAQVSGALEQRPGSAEFPGADTFDAGQPVLAQQPEAATSPSAARRCSPNASPPQRAPTARPASEASDGLIPAHDRRPGHPLR